MLANFYIVFAYLFSFYHLLDSDNSLYPLQVCFFSMTMLFTIDGFFCSLAPEEFNFVAYYHPKIFFLTFSIPLLKNL